MGPRLLLCETDLQYIEKRNRYLSRAWDFTLDELSLPVLLKVRRGSPVARRT